MKDIPNHCSIRSILVAGLLLGAGATMTGAEAAYSDQDITLAVETEMYSNPGVDPNDINIRTDQGVVTLTGEVDNLLAKERALAVAEAIKGVRSVVNRIIVQPGEATDRSIRNDILEALVYDPVTESWELGVEVSDGQVTLDGRVDSWQERTLAAMVVKGVAGVTDVKNDIKVDHSATRPDIEVREEIEKRLLWDALVDDALINVAVKEGTVTLSGTVGSAAEKRRAETDAWVYGVNEVDTEDLEVKFWARDDRLRRPPAEGPTDAEVEQAVEDAFLYDPRVLSFNVSVDVTNGRATLNGSVDNARAKQAAAQDARNTVGVWHIQNHIRVRPTTVPDQTIARNVRKALLRDPYVDKHEIAVSVDQGQVTLTGTVDTAYEKAQAENVARGARGVLDVANHLVAEATWLHYNPYIGGLSPFDYDWYEYPSSTVLTDLEIEQRIRSELFWSPFVDEDQVQVRVDRGQATLSGTVDTWTEYLSAEENAREGGAVSVDNNLEIQAGAS